MMWQEFSVIVKRDAEELISYLLVDLGAQGVAVEDPSAYQEQADHFGELYPHQSASHHIKVSAYYPETTCINEIKARFMSRLQQLTDIIDPTTVLIQTKELAEENWAESWKRYYTPTRISRHVTIVPAWIDDYPANKEEKVIRLDPGMAFGTGTHSTTKLSIYALEQVLRGGEIVLDVGTGSGVLAITSIALGAKKVYAYDLDEQALQAAQKNSALNGQLDHIQLAKANGLQTIDRVADVIVANILADILLELIEKAYHLLKQEGCLILSGIIKEKWEMIEKTATHQGFSMEMHMIQGEWHTGVFKKTQQESGIKGG